jgi:hypothetical protein
MPLDRTTTRPPRSTARLLWQATWASLLLAPAIAVGCGGGSSTTSSGETTTVTVTVTTTVTQTVTQCAQGEKECSGACANVQTDAANCGDSHPQASGSAGVTPLGSAVPA